jgi:phosphoenolpyruvate carboxykinase (ATP)
MYVDVEELLRSVEENVRSLESAPNALRCSSEELRRLAEQHAVKTKYGNLVFMTSVRNRSAGLTVYVGSPNVMNYQKLSEKQMEILEKVPETLHRVHNYVKKAPLVRIDKVMGSNDEFTPLCTMYVSVQRRDSIRLAYMLDLLLFDESEVVLGKDRPRLYLLYIPEWQEKDRQILVFPEIGVTYVLGSDYFGEAKKGFLRMAMWYAKQKGFLGIHAGAKIVRARGTRRQASQILHAPLRAVGHGEDYSHLPQPWPRPQPRRRNRDSPRRRCLLEERRLGLRD